MKIKQAYFPVDLGEVSDTKIFPSVPTETKAIPSYNERCMAEYQIGKSLRVASSVSVPAIMGMSQLAEVGKGERKRREGLLPFNACVHQKVRSRCLPYGWILQTAYEYTPARHTLRKYYRNGFAAADLLPKVVQEEVYMPSYVDFWTARTRAWHNMQPRFEGAVSMLNFLLELKDFKDVSKAIANHRSTFYNLSKRLSKLKTKWDKSGNTAAFKLDPSKPAAEATLINNFAVQPLIRDLADIVLQANLIVSEVQKQYLTDGLSFQRTHYSEVIEHLNKLVASSAGDYASWSRTGSVWKTKFTAHLYYKYSYEMRSAYEAFMTYWGLCGSFEALWNAMPWSFLVDYFVGIGKSMHAMQHDPNVTLTQWFYGESYKTTISKGMFIYPGSSRLKAAVVNGKIVDFSTSPANFITGWEGTLYTRQLTSPIRTMAFPKVRLPSGTQALNMLALARCFF